MKDFLLKLLLGIVVGIGMSFSADPLLAENSVTTPRIDLQSQPID